jgi:dihydroxy-acid dehydratase
MKPAAQRRASAGHPDPNAFENAIASVAATSGSTNAVLHLLAIAREAGVPLDIDDFQKVSERTPILADLKPSGRFVAADVHSAGGIRLLASRLLSLGLLHGDAITVSGKTMAEEAAAAKETPGQEVIVAPRTKPLKSPAAWSSCMATLRPKAAWPRSAATSGSATPARRASLKAKSRP